MLRARTLGCIGALLVIRQLNARLDGPRGNGLGRRRGDGKPEVHPEEHDNGKGHDRGMRGSHNDMTEDDVVLAAGLDNTDGRPGKGSLRTRPALLLLVQVQVQQSDREKQQRACVLVAAGVCWLSGHCVNHGLGHSTPLSKIPVRGGGASTLSLG